MTKPYIPFLAFLALLLLVIPYSHFDIATSVVPGWHTRIYPPQFVLGFIVIIVLLFVVIGYWLISKRVDKTNWMLFTIHILLTIPSMFYIKFYSIFLNFQIIDYSKVNVISFPIKLIPWAQIVFVIGQILFLIYFIRVLRRKK